MTVTRGVVNGDSVTNVKYEQPIESITPKTATGCGRIFVAIDFETSLYNLRDQNQKDANVAEEDQQPVLKY